MKRLAQKYSALVAVLSFCFLFSLQSGANGEKQQKDDVSFRWAFGAMVGQKGDQRLVAITRDTVLKTGDRLKLLIQLNTRCFVYLFYRTGDDDISLLFPYALDQFEKDYQTGIKYYIPQGSNWFELDQKPDIERFYLLASAQRLSTLEAVFHKYTSASVSDKRKFAKKLIAQIKETRRQHHRFASKAERPIAIGGNVRGERKDRQHAFPDIDPIASEVNASDFYGKTFTIEHK
ncbi:MAG: DUF4384 domain-containing protein [Deltaproteobacteria bacterium]|nr:DUF4384 domain-containing protein [Deltaproteobacteria bacterium]